MKETGHVLDFRVTPQQAKPDVWELAEKKLADIEAYLPDLKTLRDEPKLLVNMRSTSS